MNQLHAHWANDVLQPNRSSRRARVAISAATAAIVVAASVMPAAAVTRAGSELDAPAMVESAERALGLNDDSVKDQVEVFNAGENSGLEGEGGTLDVTFGGSAHAEGASDVTYTVDTLNDATTRLASIHESADDTTAAWDLGEGNELYLLDDGRVSVGDAEGNLVAGIEAPWAVDANGNEVETYYSVDGTTLVQHVVPAEGTVFPVVADPTLKVYPFYFRINFNRSESYTVVGTVASCAALLSKAPHPAMRALMVGCATLAAFSGAQLAGGKCVSVHVVGAPPTLGTWWPTFPKC